VKGMSVQRKFKELEHRALSACKVDVLAKSGAFSTFLRRFINKKVLFENFKIV
jgi:hypothetical protein